eukprot:14824801-Heterocapsa_arctica.AAC.1
MIEAPVFHQKPSPCPNSGLSFMRQVAKVVALDTKPIHDHASAEVPCTYGSYAAVPRGQVVAETVGHLCALHR